MKPQILELMKLDYLRHIKKFMVESGGLVPHITIFAEKKEDSELFDSSDNKKPSIVHIPIPDEFLESDDSKDKFVDEVLPEMILEVKKDFNPVGIAWASEAWVRVLDKNASAEKIKNYKEIPISKEVVIVSIETEDNQECVIYDIIRNGMKINSEGDLVDIIELKEEKDLINSHRTSQGRFVGLYNKIK